MRVSLFRLRDVLNYNPETGIFTRRIKTRNYIPKKSVAGYNSRGYIYIGIDHKLYRASHLAWFYVHGKWPTKEIDHIDRNPSNNSINNLREASSLQQKGNTSLSSKNTSGYKGVGYHKASGRWRAYIAFNRRHTSLGYFNTAEEAAKAYKKASREKWGEFAYPASS